MRQPSARGCRRATRGGVPGAHTQIDHLDEADTDGGTTDLDNAGLGCNGHNRDEDDIEHLTRLARARAGPTPGVGRHAVYARRMSRRNLDDVFASFEQPWEPRIVAQVNDYDVRVAKVDGEHAWHSHGDTDEFFLVLDGCFTIDLRDSAPVVLGVGDTYVVPRGVEHRPRAEPGTRILMFEPTGTPSTGDQGPVDHLPSTTGIEPV